VLENNFFKGIKKGMTGIGFIENPVLNCLFLQIAGLLKIIQFFSNGICRFMHFFGQTTQISIIGRVYKKLHQNSNSGFGSN